MKLSLGEVKQLKPQISTISLWFAPSLRGISILITSSVLWICRDRPRSPLYLVLKKKKKKVKQESEQILEKLCTKRASCRTILAVSGGAIHIDPNVTGAPVPELLLWTCLLPSQCAQGTGSSFGWEGIQEFRTAVLATFAPACSTFEWLLCLRALQYG